MTSWVALVVPGGGYGPLGAALRIPVLALEGSGAEALVVSYPARTADPDEPWWSELRDSVARQVASAVTQAQRVTFVAKSLGTKALASLDSEALAGKEVDAIWLTPLFGEPEVRSGAIELGWRSLLVAGQADAYHEPDHHEAVRDALSAASVVLPGADHRLEVAGDALATVAGLRQLAEAVTEFVGEQVRSP